MQEVEARTGLKTGSSAMPQQKMNGHHVSANVIVNNGKTAAAQRSKATAVPAASNAEHAQDAATGGRAMIRTKLSAAYEILGSCRAVLRRVSKQLARFSPRLQGFRQESRHRTESYAAIESDIAAVRIEADTAKVETENLRRQLADANELITSLSTENALNEFRARHRKRERDTYRKAFHKARYFVFKPRLVRQRKTERRKSIELIEASGLFDADWYVKQDPKAGSNPIGHYLWAGALEGMDPHPLFDTDWYLRNNRDARWHGENPLVHYLITGWKEGRSPHPWFDVKWYLTKYPELGKSAQEPLAHFLSKGWRECKQPHPQFDGVWYRESYGKSFDDDVNPLLHYVTRGRRQGNQPNKTESASQALTRDAAKPSQLHSRRDPTPTVLEPAARQPASWRLFGQGRSVRKSDSGQTESFAPALLDLQYAQGAVSNNAPVRHKETVSIIIPSYNDETWIARAINSALSQQGLNTEVIVVDDGSTDGSVAIAREIAETAPTLRVISLLRNFGCYYARNIGVMNAQGSYIAIVDSDDIITPDRLLRQMDALKANPGAVALRCYQRRWSADFSGPLSELKPGEASLLWKREIIGSIGWYDTVRFGGDAEFRFRIQRAFGLDAVAVIPDELYFARTVKESLTTRPESRVFSLENGTLRGQHSAPRASYENAFTAWQKACKPDSPGAPHEMNIEFPLLARPFALGADTQSASPSLEQRRVGAMASFPPRRASLKACLASILPQLDEIILYLNDYDDTPDFARHQKIHVVRSQSAKGNIRDNGKFFALPQDDDAYIFTLDDDLLYPPDYVARMIHQIEMLGRSSVVGLHGVIFPPGEFTRLQQRTVYHFRDETAGHFVDLLGTGTTAWHSSTLKLTLDDFFTTGVCDLWFAATAAKNGAPLFAIPRKKSWLKEYERFEENLYTETLSQPESYFDIFNRFVAPALKNGLVRRQMEAQLARGFDADTLAAAGIVLLDDRAEACPPTVPQRRSLALKDAVNQTSRCLSAQQIHFHIVVNGWNCRDYVDDCLRSIATQLPDDYTYDVTLVDDGSTDGTYEKLAASTLLPRAKLVRVRQNAGPAHARHVGINAISNNPEDIVVLVDMDDALEPQALRVVARRYQQNERCLMTIGNWHDQHGKLNPQPFYSADEIDNQSVRDVELFNATALRTFRRKLYDAIEPADLRDSYGKWLETCTDVALMYPLLDQCWSDEVEFISEPIYRYTRKHGTGTLARFGKPHKVERLALLKSKTPKARLRRETLVKVHLSDAHTEPRK